MNRRGKLTILLLATLLGLATAQAPPAPSACQSAFQQQMNAAGQGSVAASLSSFIDPQTTADSCEITLGSDSLQLVFSDEFQQPGRKFGVEAKDPRWTAEDMYYFPTMDLEVYKPEQITTYNGRAVITMEQTPLRESAISLQPDGTKWDVFKNYKSGMMNTWNKWCYTGGYMEVSVRLPGNTLVPGFWPAFWAMGNLGRAGYMPSTNGFWPYSFDVCGEGSSMATAIPESKVPSMILPSCLNVTPDRNKYGMANGTARTAPEFDVFEVIVSRGVGAQASQTLQMAPLIPPGQTWQGGPGLSYPGSTTPFATQANPWQGYFGRPGNRYQDSISAVSNLGESFYQSDNTFGVDWVPGQYLRWYVNRQLVYEITPDALGETQGTYTNGSTYKIGERKLPDEAMYMILNLGMSESFGEVDLENLPFPAYMLIDYVRVYQRPKSFNLGCSPANKPTAEWINCHKQNYMTDKKDNVLFGPCNGAGAVRVLFNGVVAVLVALAAVML